MKSIHLEMGLIEKTLATSPVQGKHLVEPLKSFAEQNGCPVKILEDVGVVNEAEVHKKEDDLWQCLEGEVTFVCGGELINPYFVKKKDGSDNPDEIKSKEIAGGTEIILKPGDWLWIPAGEAHQHSCGGTARLVIIKIPRS
jgi:mannose-6-phosphate isomerase-like protein (cupin superfamily)